MADFEEARDILESLGMPPAQRNRMAGMTLVALCGLRPDDSWSAAVQQRCTVTKGIMEFLSDHYGSDYAPNTRETFRRQVLHQFIQARIVDRNSFEPDLPTNSPRTHYTITKAALQVIRCYQTEGWNLEVKRFRQEKGTLVERYARDRNHRKVPVKIPDGREISLSPGQHNELQRLIVEDFAPRFVPGARLLYFGDTAKKNLLVDEERLAKFGIPITGHDKLPDVVLYDEIRQWLFLIEAVTSHGPVSPTRMFDLEAMLSNCWLGAVYVSAFLDQKDFRQHSGNIAWETEVWISETPEHLIHYDGDRLLGPRPRND